MRRALARVGFACAMLTIASPGHAQADRPLEDLATLPASSSSALRDAVMDLLEDPERLNHALDRILAGDDRWRLLKGLNLRFKTFEAAEDQTGLGVSYAYAKGIKHDELGRNGPNVTALDLQFAADGNIAFERDINPRDFLTTEVTLAFEMNRGGVLRLDRAQQERLDSLEQVMAGIEDEAELDASPAWREFIATHVSAMTTQFWLSFAADGRFESDQSFDRTQFVYGGTLALDLKAWNEQSALAAWNVFDWPFAAIRWLAGTDSTFRPRGQAYPTVRLGLALVDVDQNPEREAIGETGSYPRLDAEVAFKSLLLRSTDQDIWFAADLRWFRELGPTEAVRAADLDRSTYFAATIASGLGPFVTYSSGRLPFDLQSEDVYELGFRFTF